MVCNFFTYIQVCVSSCPNETFVAVTEAYKIGEWKTKQKMICKENVTTSWYPVRDLVAREDCAAWYIQSSPGKHLFFLALKGFRV